MRSASKTFRLILLIQLALMILSAAVIVYKARHPVTVNVDLSACTSEYAGYADDEFSFDETIIDSADWVDALISNDIPLKAGSYTLNINYACAADKMFALYDGTKTNAYIRNATGYLRSEKTTEVFKFRTTVDLDAFHVNIKYQPFGYLRIRSISIESNCDSYKKAAFLLLVFFILFDISYIKRDLLKENRKTVMALGGIILISSLPLLLPDIAHGHDLDGALLRIEGIYLELRKGVFPVRMHDFCLKGYGYPISVYYGDLSLYFPAFLRIAGFNITRAWKIYILSVNAATALISYFCFKRMTDKRSVSLLMALAYTTAPYRLSDLYVRSAVGEFTSMTFLPLIALAVYLIYTQELTDKNAGRYSTLLAAGVSAVLCTHLLSTLVLVFSLTLFALVSFRKTFTGKIIKTLLISALKTVLLSSYYLIPFIDYYFNVSTDIKNTVSKEVKTIQLAGAYISDYFSITHSPFGSDRVPCSPGLILMACLMIALILLINRQADRLILMLSALSVLFLFMASSIFPWDSLTAGSAFFRILAQVQLPTRFLCVGILLLTLLLMPVLDRVKGEKTLNRIMIIAAVTALIQCSLFTGLYEQEGVSAGYTNTSTLDSLNVGSGEYVRYGSDRFDDFRTRISDINRDHVLSVSSTGKETVLDCDTGGSPADVIVPKYNYKGYHAYDDQGREYPISDGMNNFILLSLPTGFKGLIHVIYKEPVYWRIAEIISVLSLLALIYIHLFDRRVKNEIN